MKGVRKVKNPRKFKAVLSLLLAVLILFSSLECTALAKKSADTQKSTSSSSANCEHTVKKWTVTRAATTEKSGKREGKCTACSKTVKETIPKISSITLRYETGVYNGNELKDAVTIKDSKGKTLKKGKDYTVTYKNNKWVGTASVTVQFTGKYSGKVTKKFTIIPVTPTIKSLESKETSITVKWKKNSKQTDGYEISYSKNSDFSKSTTVSVDGRTTTEKTIKKLTKSTDYYVRIRAYKTSGGKKYYSSWSAKSAVTTKGNVYDVPYSVPKSKKVKSSYFNDAVFVGDSISLKLYYYNMANNALGKAKFLTAGSLSATNALWEVSSESVHPRYNGKKMKIEDAIAQMGAKKVYIMLGMNDIGLVGEQQALENFKTLCKRIKKKSPDVKFYVQSVTPRVAMTQTSTVRNLTNARITEYNKMLSKCCKEKGWYFVNVASVMFDNKGNLKYSYCGDPKTMGMHFTDEGCKAWVDYLYTHTA